MKRRLRIILIFHILGAILNVAVVLVCVINPLQTKVIGSSRGNYDSIPAQFMSLHKSFLPHNIDFTSRSRNTGRYIGIKSRFGYYSFTIDSSSSRLVDHDPVYNYNIDDLPWHTISTVIVEAGWPLPCFWAYDNSYYKAQNSLGMCSPVNLVEHIFDGYKLLDLSSVGLGRKIRFPFYVRSWAALGNTLFYALILWIPYQGLFLLRRRGRIRRGLCGKCAYPVAVNAGIAGASPVCTECGTPIPGAPEEVVIAETP